jgi:hypothetical protein
MSGAAAVFHRLRLPLWLICAALVAAGVFAMRAPSPVALAAACLGGFLAAYARLRHAWLALAAALAPLPGIAWFGASGYALCLALAVLITADYDDALLRQENPHAAWIRAVPALAAALLLASLWSLIAPANLPGLLAAAAATMLCLPLLLLGVEFTEETIIRGNRQRERLLRLFGWFGRIAEPRWSISVSGIAVVLTVLGYFEIAARPPLLDWLSAPLAAALLYAFTRDIHAALAAMAAAGMVVLFTGGMGGAMLLFLLFAVGLERGGGAFRARGENAVKAARRAIEQRGGAILFAGLAAMAAAVPRGGAAAALHAGCGLIAALVFFPAFTGALRRIFPARRSVEDIYRTSVS